MPYNQSCSAGVAHLVERDLAKVEVASSSLVARSTNALSRKWKSIFLAYKAIALSVRE